MQNNLAEDYVLGNDIDASGSTTLNYLVNFYEWIPNQNYDVNDYVTEGDNSWYCHTYHTSGGTFSSTNWYNAYYNVHGEYLGFKPVGTSGSPFTGTLDGKGYTISGLYINRPIEDSGLFYATDGATIANLALTGVDITGDDTGGLAYLMYDTDVSNVSISGSVNGIGDVGGLVGYYYGLAGAPTMIRCHSVGTVSGHTAAGGLISNAGTYDADILITECYSTADVSTYLGGATKGAGFIETAGAGAVITKCYATGDVATPYDASGFAFYVTNTTITNCYARGDVHSTDSVAAGFSSYARTGAVLTNCYSTGLVESDVAKSNYEYGFADCQSGATASNCFWDKETSGVSVSGDYEGGTGKTTVQMKTKTTFTDAGWDFTTIWTIYAPVNDGYPYFGWEAEAETHCFTIPDLFDDHGRVAKGAWVRAYRADTLELVGEGIIDQYGNATICGLPNGIDIVFHVTWGGGYGTETFSKEIQIA